ncbi:hypothetical protein DM860_016864 [Cuscuta australis]|uniref:Uncharacterized protein n=1 Tax=Cuscuta australis TaxID=267555 RepID=A0A328DXD7_9ASTE|nr:hypothetical protein DM860_016864 [Cuscuta australis]
MVIADLGTGICRLERRGWDLEIGSDSKFGNWDSNKVYSASAVEAPWWNLSRLQSFEP